MKYILKYVVKMESESLINLMTVSVRVISLENNASLCPAIPFRSSTADRTRQYHFEGLDHLFTSFRERENMWRQEDTKQFSHLPTQKISHFSRDMITSKYLFIFLCVFEYVQPKRLQHLKMGKVFMYTCATLAFTSSDNLKYVLQCYILRNLIIKYLLKKKKILIKFLMRIDTHILNVHIFIYTYTSCP